MKRILALLAACLVLSLAGCGAAKEVLTGVVEEVTKDTLFRKAGFSITLPAYAVDASKASSGENEPYVFVVGQITVCAMALDKEAYGADITAEEYAQALLDANGYPGSVSQRDGLPTFTFTSEEDALTYLCITAVTEDTLWYVNASCAPENFEKYSDTMWSYLATVQVE